MSKQTVIITGASRGLGAATAKIAAQLGANVVLNARSEDDLIEVATEIRQSGGQALVVPGDVGHVEDCWRLVNKALREFGQVDSIVNNAGIIEPIAPIAQGDPRMWRTNVEVNILGPVFLTQAALPHLRKRSGRVINVSSGAAVKIIEGWAAYCAAKSALNHFTRVLAAEETAVTAIAFRPGVVDTEMQAIIREQGEAGMPVEHYEHYIRLHQEGKLLPPELPGRSMAALSLYAPPSWSGEFIAWDEERVRSLIN